MHKKNAFEGREPLNVLRVMDGLSMFSSADKPADLTGAYPINLPSNCMNNNLVKSMMVIQCTTVEY
ncbi:hypothetical protein [Spartinivicinus poritis]|uniref:Uncharacterized protein n=1 Tax=Spartinivicinus poritis TaxID=2994640 RepID=A0ABT5U476_9GAMM|nr:hypothetical protein [Spartinivicinus sp. A2-2]MDE1461025.1 hypothetical protein [Spartinivicinus sp. A2-2]